MYLLVAIEITSLLRHKISNRVWHAIHLCSYLLFGMVTIHFVTAGTDVRTMLTSTAAVLIATAAAFGSAALYLWRSDPGVPDECAHARGLAVRRPRGRPDRARGRDLPATPATPPVAATPVTRGRRHHRRGPGHRAAAPTGTPLSRFVGVTRSSRVGARRRRRATPRTRARQPSSPAPRKHTATTVNAGLNSWPCTTMRSTMPTTTVSSHVSDCPAPRQGARSRRVTAHPTPRPHGERPAHAQEPDDPGVLVVGAAPDQDEHHHHRQIGERGEPGAWADLRLHRSSVVATIRRPRIGH